MKTDGKTSDNPAAAVSLALVACAATLTASVLLSGCNTASASVDRADYSTALNRYYEGRPMCLWSDNVTFPVEAVPPEEANQRGYNALVDAGLLERKRATKGDASGSYTYDLTREGHSALDRDIDHPNTGNFCYGRRRVLSIDADRQNSPTTERIDFHYHVTQPSSWATEVVIQHAFPQVVAELSSSHKAEAILLDTDEGWEVSKTPVPTESPTGRTP